MLKISFEGLIQVFRLWNGVFTRGKILRSINKHNMINANDLAEINKKKS